MGRRFALLFFVFAFLVSGCGLSFQNLPVGRDVDGSSYRLTAVFENAAQLPVGGQVRIGQAVVGRVKSLRARDFQAVVEMEIGSATRLPVGTTARLELTSVLGEEYVLLMPPSAADRGFLAPSAVIGISSTSRAADVENTLAAVGALISGSGLDQVRTIVTEANKALAGHEQQVRTLLNRLATLLRTLDTHRVQINRTITALNTFAAQAASNRTVLQAALTRITPSLNVLLGQRTSFNALLTSVTSLSRTTTGVLAQTRTGITARARQLEPVLTALAGFDTELSSTLMALQTFQTLFSQAIPGDYLNLDATLDVPSTFSSLVSGSARIPDSSAPGGVTGILERGTR